MKQRLQPGGLRYWGLVGMTWCWMLASPPGGRSAAPLALHPQNPHYFIFRGKPEVLITSGEHYGAVLNLDFNYVKYLDTLKSNKLNLTRLFTGSYVEPAGAFNITSNTLAPVRERFICPWARSATNGYANGGNKFDLTRWDAAYFKRLKDFVGQAGKRGIVVEVNLFCPFYEEAQWNLSPQNVLNNINGLGGVARTNVYTLDQHGGLLDIHDALVRKIVLELKEADNVFYEVCNEPYFGGVTMAWQHHIVDTLVEAEKNFKYQHLISQNIANGSAKVVKPHPAVSIFNFHYANPPDTVNQNYGLKKAIGDNETGFKGTNNIHYRFEGWEFMIAGGALYNNLDYSFAVGWEDGTFAYPARQPGGGNPILRRQLEILRDFIHSFDFIHLKPDNYIFKGGLPAGGLARALVLPGKEYAIYIKGGGRADLRLEMPAGQYQAEWLNPRSGLVEKTAAFEVRAGVAQLASPDFQEDIALRIKAGKPSRGSRKK